jgi:hypothetical protein
MKHHWKKWSVALVVLATFTVLISTASAEVLKAFATRSGNQTGNGPALVALNNGGATGLAFSTPGPSKLIKITYNAECASLGPAGGWVSVTIFVDGVQANPASGTAFALCTQPVSGAFVWTGAVRQSLITVPVAGGHLVQVRVDINNGATTWWLGDSSIVVEQR